MEAIKKFLYFTIFGLKLSYYIRNALFSCIFVAIIYYSGKMKVDFVEYGLGSVGLSLLYPYSRWLYEQAIGYITGENTFITSSLLFLFFKLVSMAFCWVFAWAIAPISLIVLYIHHNNLYQKILKDQDEENDQLEAS